MFKQCVIFGSLCEKITHSQSLIHVKYRKDGGLTNMHAYH